MTGILLPVVTLQGSQVSAPQEVFTTGRSLQEGQCLRRTPQPFLDQVCLILEEDMQMVGSIPSFWFSGSWGGAWGSVACNQSRRWYHCFRPGHSLGTTDLLDFCTLWCFLQPQRSTGAGKEPERGSAADEKEGRLTQSPQVRNLVTACSTLLLCPLSPSKVSLRGACFTCKGDYIFRVFTGESSRQSLKGRASILSLLKLKLILKRKDLCYSHHVLAKDRL